MCIYCDVWCWCFDHLLTLAPVLILSSDVSEQQDFKPIWRGKWTCQSVSRDQSRVQDVPEVTITTFCLLVCAVAIVADSCPAEANQTMHPHCLANHSHIFPGITWLFLHLISFPSPLHNTWRFKQRDAQLLKIWSLASLGSTVPTFRHDQTTMVQRWQLLAETSCGFWLLAQVLAPTRAWVWRLVLMKQFIEIQSIRSSCNRMYEYVSFRGLGPCHGEVPLQHGKLLTDGSGDVVAVTAEAPRLIRFVKIWRHDLSCEV